MFGDCFVAYLFCLDTKISVNNSSKKSYWDGPGTAQTYQLFCLSSFLQSNTCTKRFDSWNWLKVWRLLLLSYVAYIFLYILVEKRNVICCQHICTCKPGEIAIIPEHIESLSQDDIKLALIGRSFGLFGCNSGFVGYFVMIIFFWGGDSLLLLIESPPSVFITKFSIKSLSSAFHCFCLTEFSNSVSVQIIWVSKEWNIYF